MFEHILKITDQEVSDALAFSTKQILSNLNNFNLSVSKCIQ